MNKILFFLILISTSLSSQTIDDYRDSINQQTKIYLSDIFPNRKLPVSIEFGAVLIDNNLLSMAGGSNCTGSCHVPSRNFGPNKGLQGSQGLVFLDEGLTECKHDDKQIEKDIVKLNSPILRGLMYRRLVLSAGQATKEEQPTTKFGGKAHQIDYRKLNAVEMFQHYGREAYGVDVMTEQHFVQAIMDYLNSLHVRTRYTKWLETGKSNRLIRKAVPLMWQDGCMNCHSGMGSVSEKKGKVVLNSRNKNNAASDMVIVRQWNYGDVFEDWFINRSYRSYSKTGLAKHYMQETGERIDDKKLDLYIKFFKKITNEQK